MTAQTLKLNTVASNLANAETPAASAEEAYKARRPQFAVVLSQVNDEPAYRRLSESSLVVWGK